MNSYPKIYIFTVGIFKILKNKASRSIFWISAIKKMAKIWHFCEFFHFYPTLDYHKIRTRTNFENPNGKNLDLHLIMWFMLKKLFWGSTDFTEAIFKYPKYQNIFRLCYVPYYWEFIQTPLFTRVQIRSLLRLVQLCCKFTRVNAFTPWYKWVRAYLGYLSTLSAC